MRRHAQAEFKAAIIIRHGGGRQTRDSQNGQTGAKHEHFPSIRRDGGQC